MGARQASQDRLFDQRGLVSSPFVWAIAGHDMFTS